MMLTITATEIPEVRALIAACRVLDDALCEFPDEPQYWGDALQRWQEAYERIKRPPVEQAQTVQSQTAYVNFTCPCGAWDIAMTDESGQRKCDCGRVYQFNVELEMVKGLPSGY